jgi:histidinol-phosphate aminotransferase
MTFDPNNLARENIRRLKPYSSARSEFTGTAEVFLDANESPFGSPAGDSFNRYPDPLQKKLKNMVAEMNSISASQIFVGNGSDEAIDLLFRIFCEPGRDEVIVCPPTYGMYSVSADINDVAVREIPLTSEFQLNVKAILGAVSGHTKLIFICSPNNPTGNLMRRDDIRKLMRSFGGIVVIDEAYIHFSDEPSMTAELERYPNLVVLQTFSKAWGMAGLRVGLACASREIIALMNAVKPPYNVSAIAQRTVIKALANKDSVEAWIRRTLSERERLLGELGKLSFVQRVYPSDANFVLVKTENAPRVYKHLIEQKIVVRDRSSVEFCEGCLRITVGTETENDRLLESMRHFRIIN